MYAIRSYYENVGQAIKVAGFWAEMGEMVVAFGFGLLHGGLEFHTAQAVHAVAFDHSGISYNFV